MRPTLLLFLCLRRHLCLSICLTPLSLSLSLSLSSPSLSSPHSPAAGWQCTGETAPPWETLQPSPTADAVEGERRARTPALWRDGVHGQSLQRRGENRAPQVAASLTKHRWWRMGDGSTGQLESQSGVCGGTMIQNRTGAWMACRLVSWRAMINASVKGNWSPSQHVI